jgi:hypothetical protein
MQDHDNAAQAKAVAAMATANRKRRPIRSLQLWLLPELKHMELNARAVLLDRAELEARSSTRIVWLLLVVAAFSCGLVLLLPRVFGPSFVFPAFGFSLLGGVVAHQINLLIATKQELSRFKALKLAERGEA